MPCYNGAAWLRECLEALLAQSCPADEVAVVDDGSTDESAAIARSFGGRVRLIQHERNRGLAVARNTALAAVECDVLASVDADVRAGPAWLSALLSGFDSPRTAAVGGRLIEAHQERLPDRWRAAHMPQHAGDLPLVNPPVLPGANQAIRRSVVRALGGYDESFRTNYEDADLQHRLIEAGYRCRYVPDAPAFHLRTDTVASVLRTLWGWLRPPAERRGAFGSAGGLLERQRDVVALSLRSLWDDMTGGRSELSYLSLLAGLVFPLADAAYAAARSPELRASGAPADDEFAGLAAAWHRAVARELGSVSPSLCDAALADVAAVRWWTGDLPAPAVSSLAPPSPAPAGPAAPADEAAPARLIRSVPRTWWPSIARSRDALAAESGWMLPDGGHTMTQGNTPNVQGPSFLTKDAGDDSHDVQAVIVHCPPWAVAERATGVDEALVVTRRHDSPVDQRRLHRLRRVLQERYGTVQARTVAAHRLGWIGPSVWQQSVLQTGRLAAGDPAVLAVVPAWHPGQIEPRDALDELRLATRHLGAGRRRCAVFTAAGALLIARRAYPTSPYGWPDALRHAWPEAPSLDVGSPEVFVSRAGELVHQWLFSWSEPERSRTVGRAFEALRLATQSST